MSSWTLHVPPPWEPIPLRRGDPLGFRGIARVIADAWVPGISGRQRDARWLTLLCKALASMPSSRDRADDKYDLMQKFERGVLIAANPTKEKGTGRHLPGLRIADRAWPDRYRYYGPWGVYKSLLITCGLLYPDDPWSLTPTGQELANVISIPLKLNRQTASSANLGSSWGAWWPTSPRERLNKKECNILCPLLFNEDQVGKVHTETIKNMGRPTLREFCLNQPLGQEAYWFHQFTGDCFKVLRDVLNVTVQRAYC